MSSPAWSAAMPPPPTLTSWWDAKSKRSFNGKRFRWSGTLGRWVLPCERYSGPVFLVVVQFRKTYHGGTEKIGPSDHRIIGPAEQPLVLRSPITRSRRAGSPDPPCLRAGFLQTAQLRSF